MPSRAIVAGLSVLLFVPILSVSCGSDNGSPTSPTSTGGGTGAPAALLVDLNIGPSQSATRSRLLEGQPAVQESSLTLSGSIEAVNAAFSDLSAGIQLEGFPPGRSDFELHLEDLEFDLNNRLDAAGTLAAGADLQFDEPLEFDLDISAEEIDAIVRLTVTGKNSQGEDVSESTSARLTDDDIVPVMDPCVENDNTLCLLDRRFQVDLSYRDFDGTTGLGRVLPNQRFFDGGGFGLAPFSVDLVAPDVFVQMKDNCGTHESFGVTATGSTDVEYTLTVTDTQTGTSRGYFNPLGTAPDAIVDTEAFATCP